MFLCEAYTLDLVYFFFVYVITVDPRCSNLFSPESRGTYYIVCFCFFLFISSTTRKELRQLMISCLYLENRISILPSVEYISYTVVEKRVAGDRPPHATPGMTHTFRYKSYKII